MTNEAISDARNHAVILQDHVALLKQNTSEDIDSLSRLEKSLSELVQMQEHVLALAAQNKKPEALAYMEKSNIPAAKEAQEELARFIQSAESKERELVASLRQTRKNIAILLLSFGITGMVFGIGGGAYIRMLQKKKSRI